MPVLAAPTRPTRRVLAASAFDPVVGDTDALARRLTRSRGDGYRSFIAAEGTGIGAIASSRCSPRRA